MIELIRVAEDLVQHSSLLWQLWYRYRYSCNLRLVRLSAAETIKRADCHKSRITNYTLLFALIFLIGGFAAINRFG